MSYWQKNFPFSKTSMQLAWYLFACIVFRSFNNIDTWEALQDAGALPENTVPRFNLIEQVLRHRIKSNMKVNGASFYHAKMKEHRTRSDRWRTRPKEAWKRDRLMLEAYWEALPVELLEKFQKAPSRELFKQAYNKLVENCTASTRGCFGDYTLKCWLDAMIAGGALQDQYIAAWPVGCPGYASGLRSMYGHLSRENLWWALCHVHYSLAPQHRQCFGESAAALCWDKRRSDDRMD